MGVYASVLIFGSKNSCVLNSEKAFKSMASVLFVLALIMPQNCFGLYLSISGSFCAKSSLLLLHSCLNRLNAASASVLHLPKVRCAILCARFASLHASLNQGANCLCHLLGLCAYLIYTFFTTPTSTAVSNKKISTASARLSFEMSYCCISYLNLSKNSPVFVYSRHFSALDE